MTRSRSPIPWTLVALCLPVLIGAGDGSVGDVTDAGALEAALRPALRPDGGGGGGAPPACDRSRDRAPSVRLDSRAPGCDRGSQGREPGPAPAVPPRERGGTGPSFGRRAGEAGRSGASGQTRASGGHHVV